jgi:CubicO group peptidase (beta-lactamase class C family)
LKPYVDREELAGAVTMVATKDKVLALATVGFSDIAARKPMEDDTVFWIASQSKPIAAAALMILVDEGKVSLDAPVEKYLPEFGSVMVLEEKSKQHVCLKKPTRPITLRDLMSHTSGLPFKSPLEEPTLDLLPLGNRVRSYAMLPLDSEPGTRYQYSNAGINTAARVIEVVAGIAYEQFLDQRLFRPLGMTDTTFWPTRAQCSRLAKAYRPGKNNRGLVETPIDQLKYPLEDRASRFPVPAGGLFSTAHDLCRFYQMLLHGGELGGRRILSRAAVEQMTSRQTPPGLKDSYGLGFAVGQHEFGHGGAYSTNSTADSQHGLIFIWLVQHDGFPGEGRNAESTFRRTALKVFAHP